MSTETRDTIQTRRGRWIVNIDKEFICNMNLSSPARWLYIVLDSFSSPASPAPFPGIALICRLTGWSEETYRKYRRELEDNEWLRVERRRSATMKFERNQYFLLDGPPDLEKPSPKFPRMENSRPGEFPSREKPATKRSHVLKSSQLHEVQKPRGEERAPGGASPTPSVSPPAAVVPGDARSKAKEFISQWESLYTRFWKKEQLLDRKQEKRVREFFEESPKISVLELLAIALRAWRLRVLSKGNSQDYFFSVMHAGVPASLVNNLTALIEEIGWERSPGSLEQNIQKEFEKAEKHIQLVTPDET